MASPSSSDSARLRGAPWRLLFGDGAGGAVTPIRGATNMAIDAALLAAAQTHHRATLRFYQWSPACLSFGRNQAVRGFYDTAMLDADNIDVVRRPTGGLAVLHDREITYSVTAPAEMFGGPRAAYAAINAGLVAGLRRLSVDAALAVSHHADRPDSMHPCFQTPAPGEVVVGEGKLVGSAQRCEQRTILQHGSILLDGDQADLVAYQISHALNDHHAANAQNAESHGAGTSVSAGITLRSILTTVPDTAIVVDALAAGFEAALGIALAPGTLLESERLQAKTLEAQYDSHAWTWRR